MKLKIAILTIAAAVLSAISPVAVADECPLCVAALEGDVAEVKRLLDGGTNPNAADNNGNTVLHSAAIGKNAEITEMLLASGANPNAANDGGDTVLHSAVSEAKAEVVKSALRSAAFEGHAEVVKLLLAAGANPNAANDFGDTVLDTANKSWSDSQTQEKAKKFREVVRLLKEAGAE